MDIHGFRQQTNNTLQRLVKMSFVPAGFWERFIARMLISLKEMDLQVLELAVSHQSPIVIDALSEYILCPETSCLCSHLSLKEMSGISAARTL